MPLAAEKIITRNWGQPRLLDARRLQGNRRLRGAGEGAGACSPRPDHRRGQEVATSAAAAAPASPPGMKWSFVPKDSPKPKYLAVNADESEPGTFKDRYILENDPHMMLEGIAIASFALGVHTATSTSAASSSSRRSGSQKAIDEAYRPASSARRCWARTSRSTATSSAARARTSAARRPAMLESLEGKKGWPRLKPPFPAVVGLFGCPTVVNNVETLAAVPAIFQKGAEWFAKLGPEKSGGTRLVCLSGSVNRPGVYEVMLSTTVRELIESPDFGQGMPAGRKVKAVIPGGSSAPVLAADEIDVALEFEALKADAEHGRLRRRHRHGRRHLHGPEPVAGGALLRRGVLRPVHALPRGHAVDDAASSGRSRRAAARTATSRRCSTWPSRIAPYPPIGLGNTICALGDAAALPGAHASS